VILPLDTNPCVNHLNFQKIIWKLILIYWNHSFDIAFLSELDSVGLKSYQNLHYPLLVTVNVRALVVLWSLSSLIVWYSLEIDLEINFFIRCFLSLHRHHFADSIFDVECAHILPKLAWFYLWIVQHILNYKFHELGRVLLHYPSFLEFTKDRFTL
jgi:hypothetical protein